MLGTGKRIFGDGAVPAGLTLPDSAVSSTGVVMAASGARRHPLRIVRARGSLGQVAPDPPTLTSFPDLWSDTPDATFEFSSAGAASFRCSWDAVVEDPCTSPASRSLGEGQHDFQVVARDASGTESTATSYRWTIDVTAPRLPADITVEATSPDGAIVVFEANDNRIPRRSSAAARTPRERPFRSV